MNRQNELASEILPDRPLCGIQKDYPAQRFIFLPIKTESSGSTGVRDYYGKRNEEIRRKCRRRTPVRQQAVEYCLSEEACEKYGISEGMPIPDALAVKQPHTQCSVIGSTAVFML